MRFSSDVRLLALLLMVILRVAHLALCVCDSFDLGGLLLPSGGGGGGGTELVMLAVMSRASARSAVIGQPGRDRVRRRNEWRGHSFASTKGRRLEAVARWKAR